MNLRRILPYTLAGLAIGMSVFFIGTPLAALFGATQQTGDRILFLGLGTTLMFMVLAAGCHLFGSSTPIDRAGQHPDERGARP